MSKGSQIAALLFLAFVGLRFCLNDRIPDDATTLAMKRAGVYGYVLAAGCGVLGLIVLWLIREQVRLGRMREELRRLNEWNARMRAELTHSQRQRDRSE